MKKEKYNIEGIEIEVDKHDPNDKDAKRRMLAYCFRMILILQRNTGPCLCR